MQFRAKGDKSVIPPVNVSIRQEIHSMKMEMMSNTLFSRFFRMNTLLNEGFHQ